MATQLDAETIASIRAQATKKAWLAGTSPEQELYDYAQSQGLSNADIDTMMGFGTGATDSWLAKRDAPAAPAAPVNAVAPPAVPSIYNGGATLTNSEIANAKLWMEGKTGQQVTDQAKSMGVSSAQMAQIFGSNAGAVEKDYGYGTAAGYNGKGAASTFDGAQFSPPSGGAGGAVGGGMAVSSPGSFGLTNAYRDRAPQQSQSNNFAPMPQYGGAGNNPYLQSQAQAIGNQYSKTLNEQVLPGIRSGAISAGGYGGSRQGIAEGNAINGMGQNLSNSLANLYGQSYQSDQGNATNQGGQLMNYDLGLRGSNNTATGQAMGFYTNNRQLDQSGVQLGANLYDQGNRGNLAQGQGVYNIGKTMQNAPWDAGERYGRQLNTALGQGPTTTTGTSNGSPLGNMVGGAVAGQDAWNTYSGGGYRSAPYGWASQDNNFNTGGGWGR